MPNCLRLSSNLSSQNLGRKSIRHRIGSAAGEMPWNMSKNRDLETLAQEVWGKCQLLYSTFKNSHLSSLIWFHPFPSSAKFLMKLRLWTTLSRSQRWILQNLSYKLDWTRLASITENRTKTFEACPLVPPTWTICVARRQLPMPLWFSRKSRYITLSRLHANY